MKYKSIHFVGIKGVGMAPLAIIAKEAGIIVTGSDTGDEFITDKPLSDAGIIPFVGFSEEHIISQDLVITTGAHGGYDNVENTTAKAKGIPIITQGEAVGLFMSGEPFERNLLGVSVAGSHGKTTTTAMIATALSVIHMDPSYVIGTSDITPLGKPGHYGQGELFIAEADEYATEPKHNKTAKFLWQHPKIAIFTNIELDHPDIYPDIESVRKVFLQFANQLPSDGLLIACGDSPDVQEVLADYEGKVITYGLNESNMYTVKNSKVIPEGTSFSVFTQDEIVGEFTVGVAGEHNALNAVATLLVLKEVGLSLSQIQEGLIAFKGTKRRMEYVGTFLNGGVLYDDYAHHPTEIKKSLEAIRAKFPTKKVICIFQPHTYSRTKTLFTEFASSFSDVDTVILMEIYPSAREDPDPTISSEMVVEEIKKTGHIDALLLPKTSDVLQYLNQQLLDEETVVITMGAGDVYKLAHQLVIRH